MRPAARKRPVPAAVIWEGRGERVQGGEAREDMKGEQGSPERRGRVREGASFASLRLRFANCLISLPDGLELIAYLAVS